MIAFSDTTAIFRVLFLLFLWFLHPSKVGMAEDLLICQGQNEDYNKYGVPGSLLERFLNQMYTVLTRPHSRAKKLLYGMQQLYCILKHLQKYLF